MVEDYDVVSNRIRERWQQICAYHWTEHVLILNIFKIKACCFMGYVHSCRQDYDKALSCLIQGRKLIEVDALQYVIPEFPCKGYYCRERDIFVNIEIVLIHLYSLVNNFMKSVIIDFESDEWKDLEIGHYTKLSVLPKLLRKETGARMRMHNVHHLNDPLEGVILINHLKKELHKEYGDDSLIGKLWEMYTIGYHDISLFSFGSGTHCTYMQEGMGSGWLGICLFMSPTTARHRAVAAWIQNA